MQAQLVQFSLGRAILHFVCACRDHKYYWHWLGIRREIHACARLTRDRLFCQARPIRACYGFTKPVTFGKSWAISPVSNVVLDEAAVSYFGVWATKNRLLLSMKTIYKSFIL